MIQLLLRADDLGYCDGVNCGIEKSVKDGLIRSVGLMPNMPTAADGVRRLQGTGISLGLHANVCLGTPVSRPEEIPSLVGADGEFKSSAEYRSAFAQGCDLVAVEDAVREAEAQLDRFRELTGQEPAYFEAHAIASANLWKALTQVAEQQHLRLNLQKPGERSGSFCGRPIAPCAMDSMNPDYDPFRSLQKAVAQASPDMPNVFVCHPAYVDEFLLSHSSLTVNRAREAEMLCSSKTQQWLADQQVQLVSYDEIAAF